MTTRYYCSWHGRRLYRVLDGREELFCGSSEECRRFLEIHSLKEARARIADLRDPRRRHPTVRIFRLTPRPHLAAAQ